MESFDPEVFQKPPKDIPKSANVHVALRQQVRSTKFKMADKKKKGLKHVVSGDTATTSGDESTNSVDNSIDASINQDEQARTSDYKNEDEQMEVVEQLVEENAEKEGTTAVDQA